MVGLIVGQVEGVAGVEAVIVLIVGAVMVHMVVYHIVGDIMGVIVEGVIIMYYTSHIIHHPIHYPIYYHPHILEDHIENKLNCTELSEKYTNTLAQLVVKLVKNSEFKRRQSAPGVKISDISFERDRRFPITNFYQ